MNDPGLCGVCHHARRITSGRGSTFWLCGLAAVDRRFPKYPRLPVLACSGWQPLRPGNTPSAAPDPH